MSCYCAVLSIQTMQIGWSNRLFSDISISFFKERVMLFSAKSQLEDKEQKLQSIHQELEAFRRGHSTRKTSMQV